MLEDWRVGKKWLNLTSAYKFQKILSMLRCSILTQILSGKKIFLRSVMNLNHFTLTMKELLVMVTFSYHNHRVKIGVLEVKIMIVTF